MKLSEHKELKKEILGLPQKEKDRLLLRLTARDKVLTEHLHFVLLENKEDLQNRVSVLKAHIRDVAQQLNPEEGKGSAKETLSGLRRLVKQVNHHFKVTKAAFEDVELRVFLFMEIAIVFKHRSSGSSKDYEAAFYTYYLKSVLAILNKFDKLHEDLQFDLQENIHSLLKKIHTSKMASQALMLNLPTEL